MKHKNSHLLVGYWSRLRKGKQLPHQTDFDPRAIKRMLADFFILDVSDLARPCYRLAGTGLCERFGFELKGTSFFAHWEAQSGAALATLMRQSLKVRLPICLSSIGATADNGMVELETVLAPVSWDREEPSRFIGMVQLLSDASPLTGRAIVFERLVGSQIVREDEPFPLFEGLHPPSPPATGTSLRSHPRAPHLRLVISHERLPPGRFESEILLEQTAKALGVVVELDSKRVS